MQLQIHNIGYMILNGKRTSNWSALFFPSISIELSVPCIWFGATNYKLSKDLQKEDNNDNAKSPPTEDQ